MRISYRAGNIDPGAPPIRDYARITDATVIPMDEEPLTIRNFSRESGKKWLLSPNAYMFRDVKVIEA